MAVLPIIYLSLMLFLFGMALRLMWSSMKDINKILGTTPKKIHPELEGVQNGDELMVIKFEPDTQQEGSVDVKFTADKEFEDLYIEKSLQKRMEELDIDDEDDDDDDGDVVISRR